MGRGHQYCFANVGVSVAIVHANSLLRQTHHFLIKVLEVQASLQMLSAEEGMQVVAG